MTLATLTAPALAEHALSHAIAQAITRVINHSVPVKVLWIHVSSRERYALTHVMSKAGRLAEDRGGKRHRAAAECSGEAVISTDNWALTPVPPRVTVPPSFRSARVE